MLEKRSDEAPWTIQQTFLGIVLTVVPWLLLTILLNTFTGGSVAARHTPLPPRADLVAAIFTLIFSSLVEAAFLIAPFYLANRAFRSIQARTPSEWEALGFRAGGDMRKRYGNSRARFVWQSLGFRGFNAGTAFSLLVGLLLAVLAANFLYGFLIQTFHLPLQTNDQVLLSYSKEAPLSTYATLFVAVVVAPFCEEVFFRGFVFPGLRRGMSLAWAIIFSALIFAVAHGDPGSFPVLLIIGLALAFIRWRTQSIWPGMLLHMLNNGIAALAIILSMQGLVH